MKNKNLDKLCFGNIVLAFVFIVMGALVMIYPEFGLNTPIYFLGSLFFVAAFFSIIIYFITRKSGYENLFNAAIYVVSGVFLFLSFGSLTVSFTLGLAMTIMIFFTVINKLYFTYELHKKKSYEWMMKLVITFLIGFLGILVITNLYEEITTQTIIIGYFFIAYGVLNSLESLLMLFARSKVFEHMAKIVLIEEKKEQKVIKKKTTPKKKKQTKKK